MKVFFLAMIFYLIQGEADVRFMTHNEVFPNLVECRKYEAAWEKVALDEKPKNVTILVLGTDCVAVPNSKETRM